MCRFESSAMNPSDQALANPNNLSQSTQDLFQPLSHSSDCSNSGGQQSESKLFSGILNALHVIEDDLAQLMHANGGSAPGDSSSTSGGDYYPPAPTGSGDSSGGSHHSGGGFLNFLEHMLDPLGLASDGTMNSVFGGGGPGSSSGGDIGSGNPITDTLTRTANGSINLLNDANPMNVIADPIGSAGKVAHDVTDIVTAPLKSLFSFSPFGGISK